MINRSIIPKKFKYRTSEYNVRYGFPEEKVQHVEQFYNRIDYWKAVLLDYLQPGQTIVLGFSQPSVDFFAIVFAALELDINIDLIDKKNVNGHMLLHNFPDVILENLDVQIPAYNHFDLADNIQKQKIKYKQQGKSLIQGRSQNVTKKFILRNKFKGNVLHTRFMFSKNYLVEILLPALACDSVNIHMCMGYYNIEEGTGKLLEVINKHGINCVFIPTTIDTFGFSKVCIDKGFDLKNISVYTIKNDTLHLFKEETIDYKTDETMKLFPTTIGINANLIYDPLHKKLYLLLLEKLADGVAEVKLKTLNRIVQNKFGMEISSAKYFGGNNDYALDLFRLTS